jgi:hypothetical protein
MIMNEIKKAQKEWTKKDKRFKKSVLIVQVIITIEEKKNNRWYLDSTAIMYVTHDLSLFLTSDLNTDDI